MKTLDLIEYLRGMATNSENETVAFCGVAADRLEKFYKALCDIADRDNAPEYHDQAMGCGLEDRNIRDRYEAMAYGWESAIERVYENVIGIADEAIKKG